jgi:hypothetical protein
MDRLLTRGRRRQRRLGRARARRGGSEAGDSYLEMLVVMPLLMLVIVAVAYFGRVLYAHLVAEVAAYSCTRTAIEAMAEDPRGTAQGGWGAGGEVLGVSAARRTLEGFGFDSSKASIQVRALNLWDRGEAVRCEVGLHIDLGAVPWLDAIGVGPSLRLHASYVGQVEAYKSDF